MIDESSMYWLTRMDYVCDILKGFGIFGLMFGFLSWVPFFVTIGESEHEAVAKVVKWLSPILLVMGMLCVLGRAFTPTTKELTAIKVVPAIVNNETLKTECSEFYSLAKSWLKESLGVKTQKEVVEDK